LSDLRENEHKTLIALKDAGGRAPIEKLIDSTGLAHAAVMRAALSLSERDLVKVYEVKRTKISLNEEGEKYARDGLPERCLVSALIKLGGEASIDQVVRESSVDEGISVIALGWLSRKGWARIEKTGRRLRLLREPTEGIDEKLLSLLSEKGLLSVEELDQELQGAFSVLKGRRILKVNEETMRELELTDEGWRLIEQGVGLIEEVSQLTPEMIRTGKWRSIRLRRFDVEAPGPTVYPGKIHPVQQIIQRIKEIFLEMGFTEIRGPIVETAFWNFDALFQPQDHPAREMMDTFYLAYPNQGNLPEGEVVERVAKTHEDGWRTGSKGWGYKWSHEEARRLVLRTHTTAATIRYLSEHKEPPIKVFSVDRVYRNERLDYKHLAEFYQVEGIIMDKNATLQDLMGTLKEFYMKLGLEKVQFWPCYFPYTEPSAQSTVYVPELKAFFELCGMGMFRPEVLRPLGIKYPVLAWGGGLERLIMLKLSVDDMRILYKNDLQWIRRIPICQ